MSPAKLLLNPAFVLPAWGKMWVFEVRVCLVKAGCLLPVFGCCSKTQGRGGQMFCEKWFLHHLVSSIAVMIRPAANQQLQPECLISNEAPAKRGFCPMGSNDSAPKDHASSGRCQTCLAWKSQLSMESATSLGRSSSPWRVFCCQMSSRLDFQVFASSLRIHREAESCLLCFFFMYLT